jgi:hypothetical protein
MQELSFGIEIEVDGEREAIAKLVAKTIASDLEKIDGETYRVGTWRVERDESIAAAEACQTEIVSPRLTMGHLDLVKSVVRTLASGQARVNETCGVHVHVGIPKEDYLCVRVLARIMKYIEPLFYSEFDVWKSRIPYAKPISPEFLERWERENRAKTPEDFLTGLQRAWYGEASPMRARDRWDPSRYYGLNIQSFLYRGTVEFRYFNSTLDEDAIESYIRGSLAVVELARVLVSQR